MEPTNTNPLPQGEPQAQEVSVKLTPEVLEVIKEAAAKMEEKFEEKQKAFSFHGAGKVTEQQLGDALERVNAAKAIKALAIGDEATLKEINARAKTITSAGSAGSEYLVPTVFERDILATFDSYSEIIADADVRDYNQPGYIFNLNELDTRVVVFATDENGTGLTASQPTFSQPQIATADWIGSVDITQNFIEDTEADVMDNLARQFGEQMALKLQARLINGDVTVSGVVTKGIFNTPNQNQVLIAATASGYTGVTASDVESLYYSAIAVDYFQDANKDGKFYMHPLALRSLRSNIRSASSDRDYLSVFDQAAMTLMGRPVVLTNQAPIPTTTTSNPFILYGNLKRHLKIRRKRGLTMKVNTSGTSAGGRNLNYALGRELVVTQRIGHQVVLAEGLSNLAT